jgi:hypothetical protein
MTRLRAGAALAATMIAALPGVAVAQFTPSPPPGSPPNTVQNRWPDPPKSMQSEPAQPEPAAPKRQPAQARTSPDKPPPKAVANPSGSAVACNGVFAKDANHIRLAMKYDSRNVVFGEIDGPDGSKLPGSILFPNDPKRRLEVLWNNEAARSGTSVIAINGKSQWIGPKGLKLGMPIQALEKMNGRAFKISGFGTDGSASVLGWEGGALSSLPGGCKVGIRLIENAKVPPEVRDTIGGDKELVSSDANVRAVSPAVAEILIGY